MIELNHRKNSPPKDILLKMKDYARYYISILKIIIIVNWLFLSIAFSSLSAEEVRSINGLDECLKIALDNSLGIKRIEEDLNAAQHGYTKTLKELWGIKVNLNLTPRSYKFYDEPIIIPAEIEISEAEASKYKASEAWTALLSATKLFSTGSVFTIGLKANRDILKGELEGTDASYESLQRPEIKLQLTQPFFLFKKNPYQRNLREALSTLKIAKENFSASKGEFIYQVKRLYSSCLLAGEKVKIQKEAVKYAEALYNIAKAKLSAGKISEIDLLQIEIQLEETNESLLSAIDDYEMECEKLKGMIGLSGEIKISLRDELNYEELQLQEVDFEKVFSTILNKSSGIKKRKEMIELAETDLEKVREKNKPDFFLNVDYGHQDKKIEGTMYGSTLSSTEESNQWDVALNLNWPIFDSGKVKTELKEYEAKIEALRYDLLTEREKIRLYIQEISKKMTGIKREMASLDKRIKYAELVLHGAEIQYKEGIGTTQEIIQAQTANSKLKFRKKEAVFNLLLVIANLEKLKATGEM